MDTLLQLLKADLRILYADDDTYLLALLNTAISDITAFGMTLNTDDSFTDTFLVVDYAAWKYKKRDEDVGLPKHLTFRLNTRLFNEKGRRDANA